MRSALLIVAAIIALTRAEQCSSSERTPIAFVGSYVNVKEVPCEPMVLTDENIVVSCRDSVYEATYRVEKVLEGNLVVDSLIQFTVTSHFGFPEFAKWNRALVFLDQQDGNYCHVKYMWAEAFPTREGGYAQCGCEIDGVEPQQVLPLCRPMSFAPPVVQNLTHASAHVIEGLRLDHKIEGDRAECARGIPVEDIYKLLRPELLEILNDR